MPPALDPLTVGVALRGDVPAMAALLAVPEDALLARLRQDHARLTPLVASVRGEPQGVVLFTWRDDCLFVNALRVAPEHRRQGLGTILLEAVRGRLGSRRRLETLVRDDNLAAQLFLRAAGWRAVATLADWFDPGVDAYRFTWEAAGAP